MHILFTKEIKTCSCWFFRVLFIVLPQVPGQTFTYRFDKLPYKYEPGITRSLRHEHKMAASLREQEGTTPDETTPQNWLLIPKTALPVRVCPRLTTQLPSQKCHVVNLSSMTSSTSVQPAPVIPVFKTGLQDSSVTSIPVSVIKRVKTDSNEACLSATLTNSSASFYYSRSSAEHNSLQNPQYW